MAKRPREYLKEPEIERLMDAARQNRQGHRDATAVLLAYRHGLRASELVSSPSNVGFVIRAFSSNRHRFTVGAANRCGRGA